MSNEHIQVKVKANIFNFLTPSMFISVLALVAIIFMLQETVIESYKTNIPLNSVIFFVIFFAIMRAFFNNVKLYRTLVFLKNVQTIEEKSSPDQADIDFLATRMETHGQLIQIQNMYNALENLSVYGHLNFNDNDARLIKSKLGARARTDRGIINYFAGILVMLGLIGTFWGLLQTISAVGEAMGAVSANFAEQAEGGESADIGEFIGSIAKPLQGMGVAFSSSLFGLSGSLFLGFLNFFAGRAQNTAIELVSRWIDNRIPQLNPALSDKVSGQKVPRSDDLKAWLAGFVYLSSKTNQKMGQIMLALSKSTEAMLKSAYQTEKLYDYQKDIYMAIEGMNTRMGYIKDTVQFMSKNVDPIMSKHTEVVFTMQQIKGIMEKHSVAQDGITDTQIEQISSLTDQIRRLNSSFDMMGQIQGSLVKEIEKLRERSQKEDNMAEFTNLVWQLNSILEEIKQKNVGAYMDIFADYEEAESPTDSGKSET